MEYSYPKLNIMDMDKDDTGEYKFKDSIKVLIDDQTLGINYCIVLCINFYYYLIQEYDELKQYKEKEIADIKDQLNLIKELIRDKLKDGFYHDTFIGDIDTGIGNLYSTVIDKSKIEQIKEAAIEAIKKLKGIPAPAPSGPTAPAPGPPAAKPPAPSGPTAPAPGPSAAAPAPPAAKPPAPSAAAPAPAAAAPAPSGPIIILSRNDWGEETKLLTKTYGKIFAVLNMANENTRGGGVIHGAGAQEENMFRRSDCSLFPTGMDNDKYSDAYRNLISGQTDSAYLDIKEPRVCFKTPELYNANHTFIEGYIYMKDDMFPFYELRSAASDLRKVTVIDDTNTPIQGRSSKGGTQKNISIILTDMEKRIKGQFNVLIEKKVRHVVLSAFGCGAFRHKSSEISKLYIKVIKSNYNSTSNTYGSYFEVISFPIYYPGYGDDNYDGFYDEFKKTEGLNIQYRHNKDYTKVDPYKINVPAINDILGLTDTTYDYRRVVMNVRRIHVFTDTLDILKNTYGDNIYTNQIVPKRKELNVPVPINIEESKYNPHDPNKENISVDTIFNNINITKYGVLCIFKKDKKDQDSNRQLNRQIIVDAAGNDFIVQNNTQGAGGVSGAIYKHLGIKQFGKGVNSELSSNIGHAKYHLYKRTGVIHVNSPNFTILGEEENKINTLAICYKNIFMELLKQPLNYKEVYNFELNLCPISSDIYSGIKKPFTDENKIDIAGYTLNAIKKAINDMKTENKNYLELLSYRVINLCIYKFDDYSYYKNKHNDMIQNSIRQPKVVSEELFDVKIKKTLATGDCLYSSIYRALKERPELLDKVNEFLKIDNSYTEDKFIQTLRNKIANDLTTNKRAPSKNTNNGMNDIYKQLIDYGEDQFNIVKESYPSWLQSLTYKAAFDMKNDKFYEYLANNIKKMTMWAGQIEYSIIEKYLNDLDILIESFIIYPIDIDTKTKKIKKEIPTKLPKNKGDKDIIHLYNDSTIVNQEHYEYFSFTS